MTQKNINKKVSLETISLNSYVVGKSVKGKGIEIFTAPKRFESTWCYSHDSFIAKCKKRVEMEKVEGKDIEDFLSTLFFETLLIKVDGETRRIKENFPTMKEAIYGDALKNAVEVRIEQKGKFIGYIPLSKYDATQDSQKDLIKSILALEQKKIYGDFDDFGEAEEFSCSNGTYSTRKYEQVHGDSSWTFDSGECEYIDGRLSNHNSMVVNDFWQMDEFKNSGIFQDIDKDDNYTVFHRKGKDFYVSPSLEEISMEVAFYEGDTEDYEDFNTEVFQLLVYKENKQIEQELLKYLKNTKEDLEANSYVYTELETGEDSDYTFDYNDGVFDLGLLTMIFDDINEARSEILEILDWSLPIKEACEKANAEILAEHITYLIDGTMVVKTVPNSMVSNPEPSKEIKLNQLKNIKRLQKVLGFELVYSKINPTWAISKESLAIKVGNEEYHFQFKDIMKSDEDINIVDFVQNSVSALNRRTMETKAKEFLKTKADKVFVGLEDSYASGNCQIGTLEFARRHNIDINRIGGIRGDELLRMENSDFTRRAVMQAITSHGMVA